jgi:hypothetical protein
MVSINKIILSTIVTSIIVVVFIVIIMVATRNKNRQFLLLVRLPIYSITFKQSDVK